MSQPTVSVLLPAFNAEPFVDAAIRSVLDQTLAEWEIIAVDDCSTDGTFGRLEAWQQRDPRIRAYRNAANRGMTPNWNACLSRATTDYVIKLDADDILRPRALEMLRLAFQKQGCVAAAVRTLMCDERLEPIGGTPGDAALIQGGIDPYADHDLHASRWMQVAALGHQPWLSNAIMVPRHWLVGSGGFDERFGCASDTEMILRVLRRDGVVAHRAYVGCYYRQTQGSVSQTYRRRGWLAWEGMAIFLLNFDTLTTVRLGRAARLYRVDLWRRWKRRQASPEFYRELPANIRANLEQVLRRTEPPPLLDRLEDLARFVAMVRG